MNTKTKVVYVLIGLLANTFCKMDSIPQKVQKCSTVSCEIFALSFKIVMLKSWVKRTATQDSASWNSCWKKYSTSDIRIIIYWRWPHSKVSTLKTDRITD